LKRYLKGITYNPTLRNIVRNLGLTKAFRNLYFLLARPKDGIISYDISGVNAKFYIRTPGELRLLESMGGAGKGEKKILEKLILDAKIGDVVYDIGGNIGLYSIFLAKKVSEAGKVVIFEPEEENYNHLMENIKLNNLKNIIGCKKALGENDDKVKLYIGGAMGDNGGEMGNCSVIKQGDYQNVRYEMIDIVNCDNFIVKNNIPVANIVKIDVEGYEYSVLKGMKNILINPSCRIVCCEIHKTLLPDNVLPENIISILKASGFNKIDTYNREEEDHIICYK
jgi:FkbM family methyltransferase